MQIALLAKYNSLKPELKASFWFVIASVFQKGMTAISTPIFTRIMSKEEFGRFAVYMSWYEIVFIFATLNFAAGVYNNAMIKYEAHRCEYTSALQTLSFVCTLLLFAIYILFQNFFNKITGFDVKLMTLMFLQIAFMPPLLFWSARERFEKRYVLLVIVTIAMAILNPLLGIIAVLNSENKVESRIFAVVIVQLFFGVIFTFDQYRKGKSFFNRKYWKYALGFNLPLIPHYLSTVVLNNTDRIIIEHFEGNAKAAIYSVAYSAAMLMMVFVASINATFVPWTYKKLKEETYELVGKYANVLLIIVGMLVLGLISIAPELVRILAPVEYFEAIWVVPPVALGAYFIFTYSLFANIEFFFEQKYFVLIASLTAGLFNVGLNWILVPRYGYLVAGYTTFFTYALFAAMHYFFMRITLKRKKIEHKVYRSKHVFTISALVILLGILFLFTYKHIYIRYVVCLILAIIPILGKKSLFTFLKDLRDK